jgi:hypothetical protein
MSSNSDVPVALLYLLTVGREKELALRIHGSAPTVDELASWMHDATVRALTVSRYGDHETSTLLVNFGHVVVARIAPYSETRSGSF